MIERSQHLSKLELLLSRNPVGALIGARQVGKTTLAKTLAGQWKEPVHFFDLESTVDLARLADAMLALEHLRDVVVLDEVQRRPEIFTVFVSWPTVPGLPPDSSCSAARHRTFCGRVPRA